MISAWGIDHGEISKARRNAGITPQRRGLNSMVHRGGEGYHQPTPEQVAASKARRAGQAEFKAAYKADKPNRRVGQKKKLPLKAYMNDVGELKGLNRVVRRGSLAGGGLLLGTYAANKVSKVDDRKREVAITGASGIAGGVGGKLLTEAGLNMGGQAAKGKLKQRRAVRGVSPNERAIWAEHKAKYPSPTERHLKYPKSLPDWKAQRVLAFKNKPRTGKGALVAGTAAGAAFGVHQARKK